MMNTNNVLENLNRKDITKNIYVGMCREGYYSDDVVKVEIPFKDIEGYLYVKLCTISDGIAYLMVTKDILEGLGIDVAKATEVALRNTRESAVVANLGEVLFGEDDSLPMWVVTNTDQVRGAAAVLNVEKIKEVTGFDNFVILPSSIHECIVVSEDYCDNDDELAEIITAVNSSNVSEKEQLGDKPIHVQTITINHMYMD